MSGPTGVVPGDTRSLSVPLMALGPGVYTVAWRTVSAVDGHLAAGSFAFGVGVAVPSQPAGAGTGPASSSGTSGGPSPEAIVARWLFLVGVILLLGAAAVELFVFRARTRTGAPIAAAGLTAAVVGALGILAAEVIDSGISVADALGSSLGTAALTRLLPLLASLIGLAALWRPRRRAKPRGLQRWAWLLVMAGSAMAMLADVLASHAAAGPLPLVNAPIQATHVLAAGVWIGGLAGLVAGLRGAAPDTRGSLIRRFSALATVAIGLVVATGLLRAAAELTSLQDLLDTDFGRLLLLKSALVVALASLGALNHFRHVPAGNFGASAVRRVGSFELLVASGVLAATAALVNVAPPVELSAAGTGAPGGSSSAIDVRGSDFGQSVRIDLSIAPGVAGFNDFQASVSDYASSAPMDASGVTLRFGLQARPDLGGSTLALLPRSAGLFGAQGANLSMSGLWSVTALVDRGAASVEIPLSVRVRPPAEQVDVNSQSGTPTIYTVHLDAGRTVQVYLDPGTAGSNDVHATFFDATGTELPVTGASITVTVAAPLSGASSVPSPPASAGPGALAVRMLEPGHFIGTTTLAAGGYEVEIVVPTGDGGILDADLQVMVTP